MSEEMIVTGSKLTKLYGQTAALKNASIAIRRGSIYGLVGNNGAGKTTFLKILAGQIYPTEGSFVMLGADSKGNLGAVRKRTGAIIENPGFYPKLTANRIWNITGSREASPERTWLTGCLRRLGFQMLQNADLRICPSG